MKTGNMHSKWRQQKILGSFDVLLPSIQFEGPDQQEKETKLRVVFVAIWYRRHDTRIYPLYQSGYGQNLLVSGTLENWSPGPAVSESIG